MKRILKKYWIWILIAVVYLLLVHSIYLFPAPFGWLVSSWSAGDLLAYGGAIIGAGATIYAVVSTIEHEREREREQNRLNCKPWIESKIVIIDSYDEFEKYKQSEIIYVKPETDNQWSTILNTPFELEYKTHRFNMEYCLFIYELSNVGCNTATSFKFAINSNLFMQDFALSLTAKKVFAFFLPLSEDKEIKYKFDFSYGDVISSAKYIQSEAISVCKSGEKTVISQHISELLSKPEILEEEKDNGET